MFIPKNGRFLRLHRRKINNAVTMSLLLTSDIMEILKDKTENSKNRNMSEIIENIVSKNLKRKLIIKRKPIKTFPIKKTFTFSPDFVKLLKLKTNNYSSFINTILKEHFKI